MSKTVLVRFKMVQDRKTGISKAKPAKPKLYPVVAEYGDGRVRTNTGDVFEVVPSENPHITFEAIR